MANEGDGHVVRIDAATNRVTQRISLGRVYRIVAAESSLWVTSPDKDVRRWYAGDNNLIRLEPVNGKVLARIPTGGASGAVAGGPAGIWIAPVGRVARVDPATNAIDDSIEADDIAWAAATGAGALWLVYQYAKQYRSTESMPGLLLKVAI